MRQLPLLILLTFLPAAASALHIVDSIDPGTSVPNWRAQAIDTAGRRAYFADPGHNKIYRIDLDNFSVTGMLDPGVGTATLLLDTAAGYLYAGHWGYPGTVSRIRLSDFTIDSQVTLTNVNELTDSSLDLVRGYAYFIGYSNVGRVRLSDFTPQSEFDFSPAVVYVRVSLIDADGGYLYVAGRTNSSAVVERIRLSDRTPQGTLAVSPNLDFVSCATDLPSDGYGYFGVEGGDIKKVRLSDMSLAGTLSTASLGAPNSAWQDPSGSNIYFGLSQGRVLQIAHNDLSVKALFVADATASSIQSGVYDSNNDTSVIGRGDGKFLKVSAGTGDNSNSLSRAFGFPSPFDSAVASEIHFENLAPHTTVRIYTLSGTFVRELNSGGERFAVWNVRNEHFGKVPRGTYLVKVTRGSDSRSFKILIRR